MATSAEVREARRRRREAALALRPEMSPAGPAPDRFRVATWNVNSLKARAPALRRFLERAVPDVLLLQETKASAVAPVAAELFDDLGYDVVHSGAGAYNGVAIAARHPIGEVVLSADFADEFLGREPRLISAVIEGPEPIRCASVYVPHGREVGPGTTTTSWDSWRRCATRSRRGWPKRRSCWAATSTSRRPTATSSIRTRSSVSRM
ncbi:MAG: endonuclease/exonuclease/phosphatase family protein [Ilumatobacteraceae bacterium]